MARRFSRLPEYVSLSRLVILRPGRSRRAKWMKLLPMKPAPPVRRMCWIDISGFQSRQDRGEILLPIGHGADQGFGLGEVEHAVRGALGGAGELGAGAGGDLATGIH